MKLFITSIFLFVCASTITAQDWEKYKYEELALIAEFPGTPQKTVQQVQTAVGELDMHMVAYAGDDIYYAISATEYPKEFADMSDERIKSVLDGSVNGAVNNLNGTLESDENITLNGYPGRKIKIKASGMDVFMNTYLVDNKMYITQVICVEDRKDTKSLNKFLDAFDIINVKQ